MDWQPMTPADLDRLLDETKGKVGSEPSTELSWFASDDVVTLTSSRGSHIAAVLRRCGSVVSEWTVLRYGDGSAEWGLRIPTRYFRGIDMAFKNVDAREEMTEGSRERLGRLA